MNEIELIIKNIYTNNNLLQIEGKILRNAKLVRIRHILCYLLYKYGFTSKEIANMLNYINHSTVLYAKNNAESMINIIKNQAWIKQYKDLLKLFENYYDTN